MANAHPQQPESIVEPKIASPIVAEVVSDPIPADAGPADPASPVHKTIGQRILSFASWVWQTIKSITEWTFGLLCMWIMLSILATVPILQFLSLGYLLESAARIARPNGRIKDGLIGIRTFARLGGAAFGTWLLLQPLRLIGSLRREAELFTGYSENPRFWNLGFGIAFVLLVGQIVWAWLRGARLRSFFWPAPWNFYKRLRHEGVGNMYIHARDCVYDFVIGLRLPYYFSLGINGFVIAVAWLLIPISILVVSSQIPSDGAAFLVAFLGGILLSIVLLYLPFAQVNYAISGQLKDGFALRKVRQQFRRAPVAFWMALLVILLFAVPLYLLKAELIPREAAWLPSLVFVLSILPARILTGWAVRRAERRTAPRHFVFRWLARLSAVPVVLIYSLIVYMTQYVSWYGPYSLYEQHAFLLPVPFLGL